MTGHPATAIRGLAARIDAATPPHRDRTVDALRALAIAGVILGHWLVTALVLGSGKTGGTVHDASPLASLPALTPASWIFQTLAVFFLVGGYAAARSYTGDYLSWLRKRLARLTRPVAVFAAVWVPLAIALSLGGMPGPTERTVLTLVLDPLWFLGVFAGLTALTPLAVAMVRRLGACAACVPAAVVAAVDLVRFGLGGPAWVGWINVAAGWMVPYLLGIAWARGSFRGWRIPALMLVGGAAATAALVLLGRVPGEHGRGQRAGHLEPEPAHPRRGDLRHRAGRPGPAAAGTAGPVDAPAAGVGGGRHGQPVGDDAVPVAPDRVPRRHRGRPGRRPAARSPDRAIEHPVDRGAARLAAGVRRRPGRPVGGVPPGRAAPGAGRGGKMAGRKRVSAQGLEV